MTHRLTYGSALKELRTFHGLTQRDLSKLLHITSQAYSNYENNKRTPDIETMRILAEFYHMTIDEMLKCQESGQIAEALISSAGSGGFHAADAENTIQLTGTEAKLLMDYRSLSEESQMEVRNFLKFKKSLE